MDDHKVKHLEFTQAVITRMAGNSFMLKGWTVSISSALIALAGANAKSILVFVALLPAISFWGLDAYYLRQERLFRALYNNLCESPNDVELFSLSTGRYQNKVSSWFKVLWSPAILGFHGVIVGTILVILLISSLKL